MDTNPNVKAVELVQELFKHAFSESPATLLNVWHIVTGLRASDAHPDYNHPEKGVDGINTFIRNSVLTPIMAKQLGVTNGEFYEDIHFSELDIADYPMTADLEHAIYHFHYATGVITGAQRALKGSIYKSNPKNSTDS